MTGPLACGVLEMVEAVSRRGEGPLSGRVKAGIGVLSGLASG
jgi:hypothetical protein